jgi:ribosome biogenesis GTPase A
MTTLRTPTRLLGKPTGGLDPDDDNFEFPDDVTVDINWKPSDGYGSSDDGNNQSDALMSDEALRLMTVPQLKELLRSKSLPVSGQKEELMLRLTDDLSNAAPSVHEESKSGLKVDLNWKPSDGFGDDDENDNNDMDARLLAAARFQSKTGGGKRDDWMEDTDDMRERRSSVDYTVVLGQGQCAGCGVKLQAKDSTLPGFLPDHVYKERMEQEASDKRNGEAGAAVVVASSRRGQSVGEEGEEREGEEEEEAVKAAVICQRCHRLRNYGVVEEGLRPGWSAHNSLNPSFFDQLLKQVRDKRCVVVTLIDAFDFHGSILPDLATVVGRNPLFVAVNKVDLLPSDFPPVRVKQWVLDECRDFAGLELLRMKDVHLVSAKTGQGVGQLMDDARALAKQRGCNIYVVGAANVGKSSLLNKLSNKEGGQSFGGGATGGKKKKQKNKDGELSKKKKRGITTSALPGTTLNFLRMEVGEGVSLFDTPGLILSHQLTAQLSSEELKKVVPLTKVNAVALRVSEGKSVLLGGVARVEFTQGRPFFLTFFNAPGVTLHSTSLAGKDASAFMVKHSGGILTPPMSPERALALQKQDDQDGSGSDDGGGSSGSGGGGFVEHVIQVQGNGWVEASCDVVLSGLGWFSVTGAGSCTLTVVAPCG